MGASGTDLTRTIAMPPLQPLQLQIALAALAAIAKPIRESVARSFAREQFEKFVAPYVQKPLLPDTLKLNYLGDPALTLFRSYGNASVLLQNKLGDLSEISGLDEIRGRENLMHGISSLINVMTELSRLAGKYSLEQIKTQHFSLQHFFFENASPNSRRIYWI